MCVRVCVCSCIARFEYVQRACSRAREKRERDRRRKQTPRKQQCFRPPWAPPHPHTPSRTPASLARTFRPPTEAALALSPQAGAAAQAPAESTAQTRPRASPLHQSVLLHAAHTRSSAHRAERTQDPFTPSLPLLLAWEARGKRAARVPPSELRVSSVRNHFQQQWASRAPCAPSDVVSLPCCPSPEVEWRVLEGYLSRKTSPPFTRAPEEDSCIYLPPFRGDPRSLPLQHCLPALRHGRFRPAAHSHCQMGLGKN